MGEFLDSGIVLTAFSALIGLAVGKDDLALELGVLALVLVAARVVRDWYRGRRRRR